MLSTLSIGLAPAAPREVPRPSLAAVRARIAAMNPDLERESATCNAAVILLAGVQLSHNVDRLARFSGLPRDEVARCARRLVDNGVWRDGNTIGRWVDDAADVESFWADVAVAEGLLCRRIGEDGQLEWAPQGYWRKHFDYVGPREEEQPQVVRYHPHVEMAPQELPYPVVADVEDEDEDERPVVEPHARRSDAPVSAPEVPAAPVWLGGEEPASVADEPWRDSATVGGPELFPEVVWLG